MSSTAVLRQIGDEIKKLLEAEFKADQDFPLHNDLLVSPDPPDDTQPQGRVVLWHLYEVRESEFLRNRPGQSVLSPAQPADKSRFVTRLPSLGLDLFYLMAPYTGSTEND